MRLQHQQPGRETELATLSRTTVVVKSLNKNPRRAQAPGLPAVGAEGGLLQDSSFLLLPRAQGKNDQEGSCPNPLPIILGRVRICKEFIHSFIYSFVHWVVHQTFVKCPQHSRECSKAHQKRKDPGSSSQGWRQPINRSVSKTDCMWNADRFCGENEARTLGINP